MTDNQAVQESVTNDTNKVIKDLLTFLKKEIKPKGKLITPFNVITAPIILLGLVLIVYRFATGLGTTTNLSQEFPWGIWIGFDVMTGVAFAGGAYSLTFAVYILKAKKYHPIIRATVLNGFLAYLFYAGALLLDLGRPWNALNVMIGNDWGTSSVLFLVAWHFMIYMIAELIEFSPAVAEWLGYKRLRKFLASLTLGAVIFGITLSTLHQSGIGALFLMARDKIHPLWYSEFIPILFFVSSIFAGLSIVIIEGSISNKVFQTRISEEHHKSYNDIVLGLAKGAAMAMFAYLFLKCLVFIHGKHWVHINSSMGYWFLLEVIGFVLIPMFMFIEGAKHKRINMVRTAAVLAALGILLNRLNLSIIVFKWNAPNHYVPHWIEIMITLAIVFIEIWAFRWVVNRMPVLSDPPEWAKEKGH